MPATQPEDGCSATGPTASAPAGAADQIPLAVTHAEMNAAYDTGEAVPLGQSVSWLVRYRHAWWVVYERGWLRITDEITAADLDRAAARLTQAEAALARDTGPRGILDRPEVGPSEALA